MYFKFKKIIRICCILAIVFIFIFFYVYFHQIERKLGIIMESGIREQEETIETNVISSEAVANTVTEENTNTNSIGKIMIPKIDLVAEIKEGTEKEIIDSYVGHFSETSLNVGNIGLAAHNRGENIKAYFSGLKNLQENDIVIYQTNEVTRTYLVKTITIIEETDFSYLEPTEDNRITLITCVQNAPNYRLCVQGVEKVAE